MSEPFCVERLENSIKEINGNENPPAAKVRRITIDGFACFVEYTRRQQKMWEELNKRLDEIEKQNKPPNLIDKILPGVMSSLITAIIFGIVAWIIAVNNLL